MDKENFMRKIEERQQEMFELLSRLIQIESVNFHTHGNEKKVAEFLGKLCDGLGLENEVYSPLSVPGIKEHMDYYGEGRGLEDRCNLSVVIPGTSHEKRLHLAAHSDTEVLGDPKGWTVPMLDGLIKDGRVWGRGACDDKYAIASVMFLIKLLKEEGIELPYDLVFTAYCDEEGGGGNGALAACLKYPADDCINLDCDDAQIVSGCSGGGCLAAGFATKSTTDNCEQLTDAIMIFREEMEKFRKRRHDELMEYPVFARSIAPDTCVRFQDIQIGGDLSLNRAKAKLCFYTSKTEEEIRKELDGIALRMKERLDPIGIDFEGFEFITRFFRFALAEEKNPALELFAESVKKHMGFDRKGSGSCLSDLHLFIHYGSPRAFCFGVGRDFGAYGGAHQPDEFVECGQMAAMTKVLADFLLNYK